MPWQSESITDPGKVRQVNEDSIYSATADQIWAVADGMGGHHRGDIASQAIVAQLKQYKPGQRSGVSLRRLEDLIYRANTDLVATAQRMDSGIVASTCAVLSIHRQSAICSWVGDSRIYRYRHHTLTQLTRDHSYQSLFDDLRNAGQSVDKTLVDEQTLTRGVGAENDLQIEHCHFSYMPGDRYLLCTDGLYKEVSDAELSTLYDANRLDRDLISLLHQAYLDGGARDNLGMILLTAA